MQPERLSGLDASFLYLERPAMHMHVAGVSVLEPRQDGPLTYDDVQRVVEARLHLAPRLRQRVQDVPGNISRPLWVDDERFDLDFHLRRSAHRRCDAERVRVCAPQRHVRALSLHQACEALECVPQ